ncbi:MAG: trypsin-like peptidase domain-containing protein [Nocardioides sp.]|uniref:S1C family serine protease n=1 Tax=Nocardioides sp. TaxID=35761 RepID=UPI0039E361A6
MSDEPTTDPWGRPLPPRQSWPTPEQTQPLLQPAPPQPRRARPSWWTWPAVAVLGLGAGAGGAALWEEYGAQDDGSTAYTSLGGGATISQAPIDPEDANVVNVAQTLLPSTVQIVAEYQGQDDGATGSGFVFDTAGHVITNNHVVADAAADDGPVFVVDTDGRKMKATIVGRSTVYDLAVLDVPDAKDITPASLGASNALRVGESVVAIGSPLGLSSTVTSGIVSALNRPVTTGESENDVSYINAVQTDAAINPGNSGGPLVNLLGQVVGVNSAIATAGGTAGEAGNIGVGFAIPIEQVKVTAQQLLATGRATYPVIGAKVQTGGDDPGGDGAEIVSVDAGTPAAKAGLAKGDIVTKVGDTHVTDGISLIVAIRTHQAGDTIELTVNSAGRTKTVEITLGGQDDAAR